MCGLPERSLTCSVGWSDPPSFVSSSGAPSPTTLSDMFIPPGQLTEDFNGHRLCSGGCGGGDDYYGHRDSIEIAELYARTHHSDEMHFSPIIDDDDVLYDEEDEVSDDCDGGVEDEEGGGCSVGGWSGGDVTPPASEEGCSSSVDDAGDPTVVPVDTTRHHSLADIVWQQHTNSNISNANQQQTNQSKTDGTGGPSVAVGKKLNNRFVCTSVSEEVVCQQQQRGEGGGDLLQWTAVGAQTSTKSPPTAPLVTLASANISRGFDIPSSPPSQQD
ncbi:hypothetical protein AAG570_000696 [Ranatra chinensis]|uniref:Uncharacterized protein n=1 Tax=Ranatra chinensis TaxID=642074 RepID=A0ABD0YYI5_9HEMI